MNIKRLLSKAYRFFYPLDPVTMYKKMGVKIGENCKIQGEVIIDYSHFWHITIGNDVTIAPRVHILAHDASTVLHTGYAKIGKVDIQDGVFIGAGTIVLPGVIIGKNSIIGAGSIVVNNIPENTVAVGCPAKVVSTLTDYLDKINLQMNDYPTFEEEYTLRQGVSKRKRQEMNHEMKHRFCFVR